MQGYGRLSHIPPGNVMGTDPFFYPTGLHDSGPGFVSSAVVLAIGEFPRLWFETEKTWCLAPDKESRVKPDFWIAI